MIILTSSPKGKVSKQSYKQKRVELPNNNLKRKYNNAEIEINVMKLVKQVTRSFQWATQGGYRNKKGYGLRRKHLNPHLETSTTTNKRLKLNMHCHSSMQGLKKKKEVST
jgi:hypothetical protein